MFRSPNDITSTSEASSSSSEDAEPPQFKGRKRRAFSGTSEDILGSGLEHQETATESIHEDTQGLPGPGEAWIPSTATEHAALVGAASLEFMYNQIAAERLNAEQDVNTFTRHSPEAQARGRQMYQQVSQQLARAGVVPNQVDGDDFSIVRRQYTEGLERLATQALEAAPGQQADATLQASGSSRNLGRPIFQRAVSGLIMGPEQPRETLFQGPSSLPTSTMQYPATSFHPSLSPLAVGSSQASIPRPLTRYKAEFSEIKPLGRGGYGTVYHVVNFVDNQHYAIKKIPLNARRLRKWRDGGMEEIENILKEIRTLARLDHHNIVRYYGAWIDQTEAIPAPPKTPPRPREMPSDQSSSPLALRYDPPQIVAEDDILFEASGEDDIRSGVVQEVDDTNDVIFGDDSVSKSEDIGTSPAKARLRRPSQATTRSTISRKSYVQDTKTDTDVDEDVESIPREGSRSRGFNEQTSTLGFATSDDIFTDGNAGPGSQLVRSSRSDSGPSVTLHIQMSLHPLSLSAYLQPTPNVPSATEIRHCYHVLPSIRIMLAITDGVEYLHSQGIVHRDLKPGNIFLSSNPVPSVGCVEVGDCPECLRKQPSQLSENSTPATCESRFITPRIGDFGLVADLISNATTSSAPTVPTTATTATGTVSVPPGGNNHTNPNPIIGSPIESALSALVLSPRPTPKRQNVKSRPQQPQKGVGTEFYRPPPPCSPHSTKSSENHTADSNSGYQAITPRLDVFSLGVILFELLYPFTTKMERGKVLSELSGSQRQQPPQYAHPIEVDTPAPILPPEFPTGCTGKIRDEIRQCVAGMVDPTEQTRWNLNRARSVLSGVSKDIEALITQGGEDAKAV